MIQTVLEQAMNGIVFMPYYSATRTIIKVQYSCTTVCALYAKMKELLCGSCFLKNQKLKRPNLGLVIVLIAILYLLHAPGDTWIK
jgi:hypothetical protein